MRKIQRFAGKKYACYDAAVRNSDDYLQCPNCANVAAQHAEVEIVQYGLFKSMDRATTLLLCGACGLRYAYQELRGRYSAASLDYQIGEFGNE